MRGDDFIFNKCTFQSRLVKTPELKKGKNRESICEFRIAWNNGDFVLFQDCVAFDKIAETISKYTDKGKEVIVSGFMFTQLWTDKNGRKRKINKLFVQEVHFCGKRVQPTPDKTEYEWEEISDEQVENLPW